MSEGGSREGRRQRECVRLVFFKSTKHSSALPIANSRPAVPAPASRVAMSTTACQPPCPEGPLRFPGGHGLLAEGYDRGMADSDS